MFTRLTFESGQDTRYVSWWEAVVRSNGDIGRRTRNKDIHKLRGGLRSTQQFYDKLNIA